MVRAVFSHPATMLELLKATFSPMDLLFYGLALYPGYRCAFRPISQDALAALSRQ